MLETGRPQNRTTGGRSFNLPEGIGQHPRCVFISCDGDRCSVVSRWSPGGFVKCVAGETTLTSSQREALSSSSTLPSCLFFVSSHLCLCPHSLRCLALVLRSILCSTIARENRPQRWRCGEEAGDIPNTFNQKKKKDLIFSPPPPIHSAFPSHDASEGQRTVFRLRTWFISGLGSRNSFAPLHPTKTKITTMIYWPRVRFKVTAVCFVYTFFEACWIKFFSFCNILVDQYFVGLHNAKATTIHALRTWTWTTIYSHFKLLVLCAACCGSIFLAKWHVMLTRTVRSEAWRGYVIIK